jgi:hypothetical protein
MKILMMRVPSASYYFLQIRPKYPQRPVLQTFLYETLSSSPAYNTRQENFTYEHFSLKIFSVQTGRQKFWTEMQEAFTEFYMYLIYYIEWMVIR